MTTGYPLTQKQDDEIAKLWADPTLSARQIGERVGRSKSAVIGHVHRLNLPGRGSPITKTSPDAPPRPVLRRALPANVAPVVESPTVFKPRSVGGCQWLEGLPTLFQFCGEPCQEASSWCQAHHTRCFTRRSA